VESTSDYGQQELTALKKILLDMSCGTSSTLTHQPRAIWAGAFAWPVPHQPAALLSSVQGSRPWAAAVPTAALPKTVSGRACPGQKGTLHHAYSVLTAKGFIYLPAAGAVLAEKQSSGSWTDTATPAEVRWRDSRVKISHASRKTNGPSVSTPAGTLQGR